MGTWRYSSGHAPTGLPGMPRQPATPPWEDIWPYSSGCGRTVRSLVCVASIVSCIEGGRCSLGSIGGPWDVWAAANAARNGHLGVLEVPSLLSHLFASPSAVFCCSVCVLLLAPSLNSPLQWLRANGAPWNGFTCAYAAANGHLEVSTLLFSSC
jgi:hypothetical protein